MNELANINNVITMTSLEIAKLTGKQHGHVLRDIEDEITKLGGLFTELKSEGSNNQSKNRGVATPSIFGLSEYKDPTGRTLPMYHLTKEGVMQLGARYDARIRFKLIQKLKELETPSIPKLPQTYLEALKALVVAEEEKLTLAIENIQMKPKAEYFDALVDRSLLTSFRDTAKELGIKEKPFIGFLLEDKYIYRDKKGKLMPYAARNNGYFEVKECLSERTSWTGVQTFVTPKGRETFRLLTQGIN